MRWIGVWRVKKNVPRKRNKQHSMQKWLWKMTNTQAITNTLALMILGLAASAVQASSLNKCLDIYGKVTYSNMPCKGANQARKIEIDPAPPVPKIQAPVAVAPELAQIRTEKNAVVKLETFGTAPKKHPHNTCDTLTILMADNCATLLNLHINK